MALDMTPEQKELGQDNFQRVSGQLNRRGFMKSLVAGAAVVPVSAAAYFGYKYEAVKGKPVRAALIGAGDEGGVLVGEHNPEYLKFVAFSDIRPSNYKERIFKGESRGPRRGFNHHYGNNANKEIKHFTDYKKMLDDSSLDIEAVVIALPLHLHAPVAIDCLNAGKHVLCEKLMAWNIPQCKKMIEVAEKNDRIITIGHQRHYSMLYAQALDVIRAGVLGDVKHIRALWHRNNSWPVLDKDGRPTGELRDSWRKPILKDDKEALAASLGKQWDYKNMEELVRWRLFERTGGGLMAELGSHQLDACSIFLGKVHPLAVTGVGGKYFYTDDREVEDHVYCTFEFPGENYYQRDDNGQPNGQIKNKNDIVVVTYSSINTNAFENYGECIMGDRGTMVVETEKRVMLWGERDPNAKKKGPPRSTEVSVATRGNKEPVLDSSASTGPAEAEPTTVAGSASAADAPVSRGYREEMEHFAYCIRKHGEAGDAEEKKKWRLTPRCHGKVAMADAIIALTANQAMKRHERIVFDENWFDPTTSLVPDGDMKATHANGDPVKL